jgi:hypothetical protein
VYGGDVGEFHGPQVMQGPFGQLQRLDQAGHGHLLRQIGELDLREVEDRERERGNKGEKKGEKKGEIRGNEVRSMDSPRYRIERNYYHKSYLDEFLRVKRSMIVPAPAHGLR